jgi:hypothetical protein
VRPLAIVLVLGGTAWADATVPVVRAKEPILIEVERPRTLVTTTAEAPADTQVFDTLGFVDASLSAVEPRGGLTVIKRPTAKQRRGR